MALEREEAIEILENHPWKNEAMKMAIKALKQEPCDDAIDRKLVCAFIDGLISDDGEREKGLEYIRHLPPVTPQPKTDVLDKIKAEIETKYGHCDICEYFENYDYEENDISEYRPMGNIADILQIIDKYKAESEAQDADNN